MIDIRFRFTKLFDLMGHFFQITQEAIVEHLQRSTKIPSILVTDNTMIARDASEGNKADIVILISGKAESVPEDVTVANERDFLSFLSARLESYK